MQYVGGAFLSSTHHSSPIPDITHTSIHYPHPYILTHQTYPHSSQAHPYILTHHTYPHSSQLTPFFTSPTPSHNQHSHPHTSHTPSHITNSFTPSHITHTITHHPHPHSSPTASHPHTSPTPSHITAHPILHICLPFQTHCPQVKEFDVSIIVSCTDTPFGIIVRVT